MARPATATPAPPPQQYALTAAAITYPGLVKGQQQPHETEGWQTEVWNYYDEVGEFRFAANWSANVCSRATLKPMKRDKDGILRDVEQNDRAWGFLDEVTGGRARQPEFIRQNALHMVVAGECSLVNRKTVKEDGPNIALGGYLWEVVGTEEIRFGGDKWWLHYEGGQRIELDEKDVVIRIWMPHPKNRRLADAASKAARPVLHEIRGYDMTIQAQQDSRLTGNGLVIFPDTITIKPPEGVNPSLTTADLITSSLLEVANLSKTGLGTAQAQTPIVMTAPKESIGDIKHITFWSPMDEKQHEMRNGALNRLATMLDLPKEVVTGTGDMNRWGAWQVEESSVKAHIEPVLQTLAMHLTTEVLQPAMGDNTYVIVYDTSTLRLRPNRSKEAIELYDRGELNGVALRRETGFSEEDKPEDTEIRRWILMQMIRASWSPAQAQAAAASLGVDLGIPIPEDNAPREARPTPSLVDHPVQAEPEKSVSDGTRPREDAVAARGAVLAFRAMERAGNRLRTLTNQKPDVAAENTHLVLKAFPDKIDDLLAKSFDCSHRVDVPLHVADRAREHCETLLRTGEPFNLRTAIDYIGAE